MNHPPYSPDVATTGFYLFLKLKESLRETKFNSNDEVVRAGEEFFCDQNPELFQKGVNMLKLWSRYLSVFKGKVTMSKNNIVLYVMYNKYCTPPVLYDYDSS